MLNILLDQADININAKDVEGKTPIWWAINNGHSAVVSRLLAQSGLELDGTIRGDEDLSGLVAVVAGGALGIGPVCNV
ncbi:hypothetical protein AFCA_002503 [Aspergillus flavus]|nr:hypothetical protein AFCA_002503 [Aspergillus flavus]